MIFLGKPVAVKSIQLGQVWRNDSDGKDYLVTKLYSEVFSQYAVLRPAGLSAPDAETVRVKSQRAPRARPSRATRLPRKRHFEAALGI